MSDPHPTDSAFPPAPPLRHAEFKAALLLALLVALIAGSVLYLMYARGAFERTQQLVLVTDDSDGVVVGMDVTFSGFPVGRVRRIELSPEGKARVLVDVARSDAHWLRSSSVFTLERAVLGGAKLRAYSGVPSDPLLPDGAERTLLVGDAAAEIPRLLAAAKELLQNLSALSATDSPLDASLHHVEGITGKLNGPSGAMGLIGGDDKNAQQLLLRANSLLVTTERLAHNADSRIFGAGGVMTDTQASIVQLNALLGDARASLKKMDAVLIEAQAVGANARVASANLGTLRAEVDSNLRNIEQLVNQINRKWPFQRDTEIKLP